MPMSDCFIGYRLRQRLNKLAEKIDGDAKKCLTTSADASTSMDIGGDVAGPQPNGPRAQGDLK